jgi:cytoskeletal protein CcmA (bactofilin family)
MINQPVKSTSPLASEPPRQVRFSNADPSSIEPVVLELATIGKSLLIRGEISGSESLSIEGRVEGSINLPGNRVTVRRNGQVSATIAAREIVVLGHVDGRCEASDNLDIGREGSLNGDVIVSRISVEDGAVFTGSIDMR